MQTRITLEEMQAAARQLSKSPRGREMMQRLVRLLDGDGADLDLLNQRAFLALLGGAWAGQADNAREVIRSTLDSSPDGGVH
jgi:hypothetical protein